jgi:hypothetical protein
MLLASKTYLIIALFIMLLQFMRGETLFTLGGLLSTMIMMYLSMLGLETYNSTYSWILLLLIVIGAKTPMDFIEIYDMRIMKCK